MNLDDIKRLLNYEQTLSLILNVDPAYRENHAARPAWRVWLKNALRDLNNEVDDPAWPAIMARAEAYFEEYRPGGRGLAIFFHEDGEDVLEMPIPVENRAAFGPPLVTTLLWKIDEYEPYIVVLVDQETAKFYVTYLGETSFESTMEIDIDEYDFHEFSFMPRSGAIAGGRGEGLTQGSNREAFEDMIAEHEARFFRDVAGHIGKLAKSEGVSRIILGGAERAARAVHNHMDERLARGVVAITNIPVRSAPHEIFERVLDSALDFERQQEDALLDEVFDMARSGGRGALGLDTVEQALKMQQVELLLLPWPPSDEADALARQVLSLNGTIEMVHGEAAERLNREAGGVAARLYYAISQAQS